MKRRYWIFFISVIILGGSVLVLLFSSSIFLFTESLQVGDIEDNGEGEYTIRLYDAGDRDVVHVTLSIWYYSPDWQNMTLIQVSIWHREGTHIDSLLFTFQPEIYSSAIDVYLKTPSGGPWNAIKTIRDGNQQSFYFPNLGFVGSGTVTLEFLLQYPQTLPHVEATISLKLHDSLSPLVLTQQQATIAMSIPR